MNSCYPLLGSNIAIRNAKSMVSKAVSSDSSILIIGENGTGKTELAKFIHQKSSRHDQPFVIIACASVQESNLEKEFSQVQSGTLLFQDIDKLAPRLQFVFIKALQNVLSNIHKIDSTRRLRLMASSSIDLENFVRRGFFREDLYLKFAQLTVFLPALRDRREDIPMLVNYSIQKSNQLCQSKITSVSTDAMKVLLQHNWPNNLHELDNLLERVSMLKHKGNIELCDLPPRLRSLLTSNIDTFYSGGTSNSNKSQEVQAKCSEKMAQSQTGSTVENQLETEQTAIDQFVKKDIDLGNGIDFYRIVEAFENKLLQEALKRAQHNKNKAAQLLSMNRTTLVEKLRKRSIFSHLYSDNSKTKYNSSFTVLDGLGAERKKFDGQSYMTVVERP